MTDWRKLAKALTLADGYVDTRESNILRKALFSDGKIDKSELEFLADVRNSVSSCVRDFTQRFIDGVKANILTDGDISATEANWLRKTIFADATLDDDEKRLLAELKAGAQKTSPEFEKLCKDCGV